MEAYNDRSRKESRHTPGNLQRWIAAARIEAPKPTLIGAVGYRL
jgi:hypothetical protein